MPYAIAADYAAYKGEPNDYDAAERARIDAGLRNAQDDVDAVVALAVYRPDAPHVVEALKRATCARFDYAEQTGDDGSGSIDAFASATAGSVSLTRRYASGGSVESWAVRTVGEKATRILANAGLISSVVSHR